MRMFLLSLTLVLSLIFSISQLSFAVCVEGPPDTFTCNTSPPNPDPDGVQQNANNNGVNVDVLPNGDIDTSIAGGGSGNSTAITLGDGNDAININNASVIAQARSIQTGNGADQITANNAILRSPVDTILMGSEDDNLQLVRSMVIAFESSIAVDLEGGNDTAVIDESTITALSDVAFLCNSGNDDITVRNSTISTIEGDEFPLSCGDGDDIIRLAGTTPNIPGGIDCDNGPGDNAAGFDTLIFALELPTNQIPVVTQQIENLPTPDGMININGITYQYRNCDEIVADLSTIQPIPTLSEWGLIAMAGILGIVGFMVIRRKKITA